MHRYLLELLQCPECHDELRWHIGEGQGKRIEEAEARCRGCAAVYPVREGIGLFLTPDLPRNDLWEEVQSNLARHLEENPGLKAQLLESPLVALAPADQLFRAFTLEEQGHYRPAQEAEQLAQRGLYTEEYRTCWQQQVAYVLAQVAAADGPVVDLASGRGYLVEQITRHTAKPLIASDFSPRVLRQTRNRLQSFSLYAQVSLLAFDARRTPFKDGVIGTLTTNLGLPNIEDPADLLAELRRIVSGSFLAISHFYPEADEENRAALEAAGLAQLLYRRTAVASFTASGWQIEIASSCRGAADPTPAGVLLAGARPDGLPVAPTTLEWAVLDAR